MGILVEDSLGSLSLPQMRPLPSPYLSATVLLPRRTPSLLTVAQVQSFVSLPDLALEIVVHSLTVSERRQLHMTCTKMRAMVKKTLTRLVVKLDHVERIVEHGLVGFPDILRITLDHSGRDVFAGQVYAWFLDSCSAKLSKVTHVDTRRWIHSQRGSIYHTVKTLARVCPLIEEIYGFTMQLRQDTGFDVGLLHPFKHLQSVTVKLCQHDMPVAPVMAGLQPLTQLRSLALLGASNEGQQLKWHQLSLLSSLSELQVLHLGEVGWDGGDMTFLRDFTALQALVVTGPLVMEVYDQLQALPQLRVLGGKLELPPGSLQAVASMQHLRILELTGPSVGSALLGDAEVAALALAPNLWMLTCHSLALSPAAEHLELPGVQVFSANLLTFSAPCTLTKLLPNLLCASMDAMQLHHIAGHPNLQELKLSTSEDHVLRPQHLAALQSLTAMTALYLSKFLDVDMDTLAGEPGWQFPRLPQVKWLRFSTAGLDRYSKDVLEVTQPLEDTATACRGFTNMLTCFTLKKLFKRGGSKKLKSPLPPHHPFTPATTLPALATTSHITRVSRTSTMTNSTVNRFSIRRTSAPNNSTPSSGPGASAVMCRLLALFPNLEEVHMHSSAASAGATDQTLALLASSYTLKRLRLDDHTFSDEGAGLLLLMCGGAVQDMQLVQCTCLCGQPDLPGGCCRGCPQCAEQAQRLPRAIKRESDLKMTWVPNAACWEPHSPQFFPAAVHTLSSLGASGLEKLESHGPYWTNSQAGIWP